MQTQPAPPAIETPNASNFLVFSDFDSAALTSRVDVVIKEAAANAKVGRGVRVTCTGHTDTAGPSDINMALELGRFD